MSHLNRYICFASLVFCAFTSDAAQLGAAKGLAVFGRPLDLSVQVKLDAPAEELASCFSADVFQADNKFDVGRVRLDVLPAANGLDAIVRIRSATAVNEPWAKVILRSHCGAKISRQYDFLTDFASDIPSSSIMLAENSPSAQVLTSNAAAITSITSSTLATLGTEKSTRVSAQSGSESKTRTKTKARALALASKSTPQVAVAPPQKATQLAAETGQPRLKMETFELTDERQVLLKLSTALVAPTGMRTPEEIQALAQATAVWRAINGMPAEVPTSAATVIAETPAKAPAVVAPPATIPSLVNQKLAGKSEFSNLMVYGLIGLLAMTLGCIAWLWLRVRKASRAGYDWLNSADADENEAGHEPTQFLFSNFHETETVTSVPQNPILKNAPSDAPEIVIDETEDDRREVIAILPANAHSVNTQSESTLSASPLASLLSDTKPANPYPKSAQEDTVNAPKIAVAAPSDASIVHPLPPHFDDPRFDERIFRTKKKTKEPAHNKPIASSVELMDLVIADSPHKLRSVSSTPTVAQTPALPMESSEVSTASPSNKEDFKGNLIDFEIFAEPEPLNKSSRFVR